MKILLIEDEIANNEGSFKLANEYKFKGKLKFIFKSKSQDISFNDLEQYALVIVDITLAKLSEMDGYSIIKKIVDEKLYPKNKIVVMTGNNKIEEGLAEHGIDTSELSIIYKPIDYEYIANLLEAKLDKVLQDAEK